MSTRTFADPRPFGIGTRTEIRLDDRLVTLALQAGDMLRSEGGLVWATVDGRTEDILLERGNVHVVGLSATVRVSAFGAARLEVYGCGPLQVDGPTCEPAPVAIARAWQAGIAGLRRLRTAARSELGSVIAA